MFQHREFAVQTDHTDNQDPCFVIVPTTPIETSEHDNANPNEPTLFGRPVCEVEQDLRTRGIFTLELEEWGGLVRAVVPNETGQLTVRFLFPDTLEAVVPFQPG